MKERLNNYATIIQKQYSKVIDKKLLKSVTSSLFEIIKQSLQGITGEGKSGVRNIHVHLERFVDKEMKWLSSTIFLAQFHDEFKIESQKAYENAKNNWHGLIQNNNAELLKLLDIYFDAIYLVVSINNKIVLPNKKENLNARNK